MVSNSKRVYVREMRQSPGTEELSGSETSVSPPGSQETNALECPRSSLRSTCLPGTCETRFAQIPGAGLDPLDAACSRRDYRFRPAWLVQRDLDPSRLMLGRIPAMGGCDR